MGRPFSSSSRRFAARFVALAALLAAPRAWADARADARTHFKAGMEHIAAGRIDQGLAELKLAYAILPHRNVLFNIARAHAQAGQLEEALIYYRRYLDEDPPDRDEVAKIVAGIEAKLKPQAPAPPPPPEPKAPEPCEPGAPPPAPSTEAPKPEPKPPPKPPPKPVEPAVAVGEARDEDVFAEKVVTASKGAAQSPLDAANSISTITEQDIRLSGITKIPELLRRLAGVEIMEVTGGQSEVSIRGFNQRLSNKVLVLVDGRSVYVDLLGATFWQALSIGVEDIERIEVVRGPASALYGADAFNGVINIISKRPGEGKSGVAGGFGTQSQTHGSLWASGREGDFAWRLAAGYDYLPRWSREVPNGRVDIHTSVGDQVESARTTRLDARATRRFGSVGTLGIGGGFTQGNIEALGLGPLNDIVLPNIASSDVTTYFDAKNFEVRVFWNRFRSDSAMNVQQIGQSLLPARAEQNIGDAEALYKGSMEVSPKVRNDLRVGAWYRYKDVSWTYFDSRKIEHHTALFLHDELHLGRYVSLVGDYRLDYVPYLSRFVQSPRGAVLVHPTKLQTIRASLGTAFRKPTFLESYLALPIQLPVTGTSLLADSTRTFGPDYRVNPERIISAEIGYLNKQSDYFVLDTSLYYNRVANLIQLSGGRPVSVGDLAGGVVAQDPSTGLYPVFLGGITNQCQVHDLFGGEAGLRTFPVEGLDVYGNYTFTMLRQDNSQCSPAELARIVTDQRTSMHKVNAGVQVRTKAKIDGALDFHLVGEQLWAEQVTDLQAQRIDQRAFRLATYSLVNARVGYRLFDDAADVSVSAFNVFDVRHREHPFGQLVGRRVMAFLTYRF